jgi:hypothetical protein
MIPFLGWWLMISLELGDLPLIFLDHLHLNHRGRLSSTQRPRNLLMIQVQTRKSHIPWVIGLLLAIRNQELHPLLQTCAAWEARTGLRPVLPRSSNEELHHLNGQVLSVLLLLQGDRN